MSKKRIADAPGYGWVVVCVAFLLNAISFGTLASVGIFLKPLISEFGWSRGDLSLGYTAITLATGLFGILWSILVDRYGSQWVALFGALALGIPLLLLSRMENIIEFYIYYFIFGALGHAAVTGPLFTSVGLWFERNVGLALGLTFSGSAVGQGVIPYITRYLIDTYSWETAYASLGVAYMVLALPITLLVRDTPNRQSLRSKQAIKQKDGTPFPLPPIVVVTWISIAVVFCCIAMSVVVVHLVPLLTDHGMTSEDAVTMFLVLMMSGALGRIWGGILADQIGALNGYLLTSFMQTSVIFLFPYVQNTFLLYCIAIIFGIGFSGVMASFLICVRMMVPPRVLARSIAIVAMFGWIGMGLGGWQGGLMFDLTGTYYWSFANGSIAGVVNLFVLFLFYTHIRRCSLD